MRTSRTAAKATRPAASQPTLLYDLKRVEQAVRSHLDEVLKPHGVSVVQYTALTVLEHRDEVSSAALARRSFVTAQTMGDVVMGLERRALVVRHPDPAHARRLTIVLTPAGRMLLAKVRENVARIERKMTREFSGDDRERLRCLLQACLKNLSGEDSEADDYIRVASG